MDDEYYAAHLAEVNNVRGVNATEDICNSQGQLLVPKGTSIDASATERIIKFKLLKPLECSVAIENQFNDASLLNTIETLFLSDASTKAIWQDIADDGLVAACCATICQENILSQKLTVLSLQFPEVFDQGIFCGVFAARVFADNDVEPNLIMDAFIAGVLHDIGMLHLNPEFINGSRSLTPDEWRQLQAHPIIGAKMMQNIPSVSKDVAKGIADHHECIDATGYPAGKISKQIHPIGLILQLLDSVYAIYTKQLLKRGCTLGDMQPIIQMNIHYRNSDYAKTLLLLFKKVPATTACNTPAELMPALIDHVKDKNAFLTSFLQITQRITEKIGFKHGEKKLLGLQNILIHIHMSLLQSGLINEAYMRWLDVVKSEKLAHAYREVEDVSTMLTEVLFHVKRFNVNLKLILDAGFNSQQITVLTEVNKELNELSLSQVHTELAPHLPANPILADSYSD